MIVGTRAVGEVGARRKILGSLLRTQMVQDRWVDEGSAQLPVPSNGWSVPQETSGK